MKDKLINGGITATTGATGLVGMINMIPDNITKVACLVGIVGTCAVIMSTVIKCMYDSKKSALEIEKLRLEIKKDG